MLVEKLDYNERYFVDYVRGEIIDKITGEVVGKVFVYTIEHARDDEEEKFNNKPMPLFTQLSVAEKKIYEILSLFLPSRRYELARMVSVFLSSNKGIIFRSRSDIYAVAYYLITQHFMPMSIHEFVRKLRAHGYTDVNGWEIFSSLNKFSLVPKTLNREDYVIKHISTAPAPSEIKKEAIELVRKQGVPSRLMPKTIAYCLLYILARRKKIKIRGIRKPQESKIEIVREHYNL